MDRLRVFRDLLAAAIGSILLMLLAPAAPSFAGVETFAEGLGVTSGVAVDPADNVYVAEYQGNVVRKFNADGQLVGTLGGTGSADGQLRNPGGLATDSTGALYVTDAGNSRVQKFSSTGNFLLKFSAGGSSNCTTAGGSGSGGTIAVDTSDDVFVNAGCIRRFDAVGNFETGWGPDLPSSSGIAVDSDGRVFVADLYHRVHRFSRDGVFQLKWGDDETAWASPMLAIHGDDVYVAQQLNATSNPRLIERRSRDGALLGTYRVPQQAGDGWIATDSTGRLYVTDTAGVVRRVDRTSPDAAIAASASPVLTGAPVSFDASGSSVPFSAVTNYRWDLDGDGSFERNTGDTPTTSTSYASRGARKARVQVTAPSGKTATAVVPVDVRLAPPPGVVGVSVNNGAQFTNSPDVTLHPVWPAFTSTATISNDGGFAGAQALPVDGALPWRLDASGPERLPKTVYLRFDQSTQTFQDDIILDQTPPVLAAASEVPAKQSVLARRSATTRTYQLVAEDNVSGVTQAQFAAKQSTPTPAVAYAGTLRATGTPRWLRVQDGAGNWSAWRAIARTGLVVRPQRLRRIRRGLELRVTCVRACRVNAKLSVSRRVARRLGLHGRTIGTRKAKRGRAGVLRMRIVPTKRVAQRAARLRKLAVTVRVTVSTGSGTSRLSETLTLKR